MPVCGVVFTVVVVDCANRSESVVQLWNVIVFYYAFVEFIRQGLLCVFVKLEFRALKE